MKKALHTLRVAYENWHDRDRFDSLLALLDQFDTGVTQVALFSSALHTPLTVGETRRRAEVMKDRVALLKEKGYQAGVNILATVGHHQEDLSHTVGSPYRTMVGKYGERTKGSFCMRDEEYLKNYVAEIYRIYSRTGAGFIWIDDDIRQGHMPIGEACFCDGCIEDFNRKHGFSFTREGLVSRLDEDGDRQDQVVFRKKWLDHNSDAICGLFRLIAKTVREIDPSIILGFMTGERYAEGYQFARYAEALSENGKYEIMWRPGGGAYTDINYDEILAKTEEIGRQNAYLPSYVRINVSEIENFPYNIIKKTPKSTAMEAAMNMTVGCTGAAFNILPSETGEPMETVRGHIRAIADLKPFYEKLREKTEGLCPTGIHTGWRQDSNAARGLSQSAGGRYASFARELFSFGLPQAFRKDAGRVSLLTGNEAAVMGDEELSRILSGGVYLDAPAADYLISRGFGDWIGLTVGEAYPEDARECYTDDPMNHGLTGGLRNGRQAFHPDDSFALCPQNDKVRVLAGLVDYHDRVLTPCTMALYENAHGGRICLAGYYPFSWVSDYFKTVQLKRVFTWLSGNRLPSYVESYCRIRNITLQGEEKTLVTLFNTTNDRQEEEITLRVLTQKKTVRVDTMYWGEYSVPVLPGEDGYQKVVIRMPEPFEGVLMEL